jgi:hypothetical protein
MGEARRRRLEALRIQREAFVEKFGREPGPGDPVFFDADADTRVALGVGKARASVLKAMRAARIPPHLVFAYAKTGFVVSEEAYEKMRPDQRAEYDAAIAEYFAMEKAQKERGSN